MAQTPQKNLKFHEAKPSERVASLSQSWILLAKKNMILASHWSIFFIIILAILNDIEGGQLRDELCCEGA